jgi:regulator of sigma D
MLVLFCQVASLEPYAQGNPVKAKLQEFCQVLVDYVAFGHFEVYERIAQGKERRGRVVQVANKIYPKLAEATEVAVAFNDKYDTSETDSLLENLPKDLSALGEELAARIELEDRLVGAMLAR